MDKSEVTVENRDKESMQVYSGKPSRVNDVSSNQFR